MASDTGVATLSDRAPRAGRPPKALCAAILTELAHSSWKPLAEFAGRFQTALCAPDDHVGSDLAAETAHQDARAIIAAAQDLVAGLPPSPHPLTGVARLHRAASAHVLFAPSERAPETIVLGALRMTVERAPAPAPLWAIEMLWGEHWRSTGLLRHALPFPGLIRPDALRAEATPELEAGRTAPVIRAQALCDVAQILYHGLCVAGERVRRLQDCQPGKRRSSRAPALLELLAGFGALRSAQIEALLGATRIGVRTMLDALDQLGMLRRTTLAGVHLYSVSLDARDVMDRAVRVPPSPVPSSALGELEAVMADIDALLARSGVRPGEAEEQAEP